MSRALVTIATYPDLDAAHSAQTALEREGIRCYLEKLGGTAGVGLQVPEEAATRAGELLAQTDQGQAAAASSTSALEQSEAEIERCLVCQTSLVSVKKRSLLFRIVTGILLQIVPLPSEWFESKQRHCEVCGHDWRAA